MPDQTPTRSFRPASTIKDDRGRSILFAVAWLAPGRRDDRARTSAETRRWRSAYIRHRLDREGWLNLGVPVIVVMFLNFLALIQLVYDENADWRPWSVFLGIVLCEIVLLAGVWMTVRLNTWRRCRLDILDLDRCPACGESLAGRPPDPDDDCLVCATCGAAWRRTAVPGDEPVDDDTAD